MADKPTVQSLAAESKKKADVLASQQADFESRINDMAFIEKEAKRVGRTPEEVKAMLVGDLARKSAEVNAARAANTKSAKLESDLEMGLAKGRELIGEGTLGRIGTDLGTVTTRLDEEQSADTQDILARRRKALAGLSAEEMSAQRGQAAEQFGRNEETNRRRLASIQANLGVRGDTAATQQSAQLSAGQQQRTNFERDMILQNRQIQDAALNAFEGSVRGSEAQQQASRLANIQTEQFNLSQQLKQRELEKFNLEQAARERFGQISVGFGMAQMANADTASERAIAAQYSAAVAKGSGGK